MTAENQLRAIFDKTGGHCHFCGDPIQFEKRGWVEVDLTGYWEIDHVIQRGKGGAGGIENSLPACTRCNRLRWHRKGEQIRELLFLGLIAKDEIKKGSDLGMDLKNLGEQRNQRNQKRRQSRKKEMSKD